MKRFWRNERMAPIFRGDDDPILVASFMQLNAPRCDLQTPLRQHQQSTISQDHDSDAVVIQDDKLQWQYEWNDKDEGVVDMNMLDEEDVKESSFNRTSVFIRHWANVIRKKLYTLPAKHINIFGLFWCRNVLNLLVSGFQLHNSGLGFEL